MESDDHGDFLSFPGCAWERTALEAKPRLQDARRSLASSAFPGRAWEREKIHQCLLAITPTASPDLRAAWQASADALLEAPHAEPPAGFQDIPEQFLILVTCRDEKQQIELPRRFNKDGLECKALLAYGEGGENFVLTAQFTPLQTSYISVQLISLRNREITN